MNFLVTLISLKQSQLVIAVMLQFQENYLKILVDVLTVQKWLNLTNKEYNAIMKIPRPKLSKKATLVTSIVVLGLIGGASAEMINQNNVGADTSPIVTEVDQQNDKLANHEARISNLETDTRVLQTNTNTQPSSNKQSVPDVRDVTIHPTSSTGATASDSISTAPTVSVPVVTAFREIVLDADTSDCEYTYSDGSKSVFHWKTKGADAWVTDSSGNNGHWVKTTQENGFCDKRALGQPKNQLAVSWSR